MTHPIFRFDLDLLDSLGRRFTPEAMVIQEDRNLVLGAQRVLDGDRPDAAARTAAESFEGEQLGRFVLAGPRPEPPTWIYRAVVHDLDMKPTSRPGAVRHCLTTIFEDAVRRGLGTLGAEALGLWRHAGLDLEEMVGAFNGAVFDWIGSSRVPLRLVLLLRDFETLEEASRLLRSSLLRRASRSFHTVAGDAAVIEAKAQGQRFQFRFVPGALSGYLVTRSGHVG